TANKPATAVTTLTVVSSASPSSSRTFASKMRSLSTGFAGFFSRDQNMCPTLVDVCDLATVVEVHSEGDGPSAFASGQFSRPPMSRPPSTRRDDQHASCHSGQVRRLKARSMLRRAATPYLLAREQ